MEQRAILDWNRNRDTEKYISLAFCSSCDSAGVIGSAAQHLILRGNDDAE